MQPAKASLSTVELKALREYAEKVFETFGGRTFKRPLIPKMKGFDFFFV
jgi:hypothetical protein